MMGKGDTSNNQRDSLSDLRAKAARKSERANRRSSRRARRSTPHASSVSSFSTGWTTQRRLRIDAQLFRKGGDVALAGVIFLAPLVLGGRHPIGRFVYISLVALLTACWVGERFCKGSDGWKSSGVEWLLIAGAAVLAIQSMRLPADLLAKISPNQKTLLPSWNDEIAARLSLETWSHISLTPHATWLALGVYLAHAALFVVLVQRFQNVETIPRVMRWIAISVTGMATLALLQFASGTDRFVWIFDHPSRPANVEVTGAFANSNHFTHFLALGIGPLIWWLSGYKSRRMVVSGPTGNRFGGKDSVHEWWNTAIIFALTIVGLAGLFAKSRGGIVVMFLATLVAVILLMRLKLLSQRSWLALGGAGILVLAGLTFYGYHDVSNELATLASGEINQIDDSGARQKIWAANWELIRRFPILGTGVGSHAEVYPRFFPHRSSVEFTHAESGYIQVVTETGIVGGTLLLIGLLSCLRWTVGAVRQQDRQLAGCAAAMAAGLSVSAIHSLFDFPWYLTSCMSIAVIMAAGMCCLFQYHVAETREKTALPFSTSSKSNSTSPTISWPIGGLIWLVLLVGFGLVHLGPALGAPHWDRYLKLSLNSQRSFHHQLLKSNDRQQRAEKMAAHLHENTRLMAEHLQNCLKHHPTHPRAHARMAAACLQLFSDAQKNSQNAMGLDQIRDAAVASKFPSRQKLNEWLDVAIGDPRRLLDKAFYHCQHGHRITPVDGRGYVYLSRLAFLEGANENDINDLLTAAEHVRPNDSFVLYQKGRIAAMRGDVESTMIFWSQSFSMSRMYRDEIINGLAAHIPAPLFVNTFQPDSEGLDQLYSFYRRRKMMTHANIVGPLVVQSILDEAEKESGVPASKLWHRCRSIYRFLGHPDKALHCARHAAMIAPNWFEARLTLADEFMAQEYYAEAIEQYHWCQKRKPFDPQIRQRLNIAHTLVAKQRFQKTERVSSVPNSSSDGSVTTDPLIARPPASIGIQR